MFIWTDAGDDLGAGILDQIEGHTTHNEERSREYSLLPIIEYRPSVGLRSEKPSNRKRPSNEDVPPDAARMHLDFGHSLRVPLMAEDPFYTLTEVFAVALASQNMLLNLVEQKLAQYAQQSHRKSDALVNLTYLERLLLRQTQQIRQALQSIRSTADSEWPRSTNPAAEKARNTVEQDFEALCIHSRELHSRCQASINVFLNNAALQESQEAITQAQTAKALTSIAFVFIPLSFVTSLFGMTLGESKHQSIWMQVVIVVLIVLVTLLVLFVGFSRRSNAFFGWIKGRWDGIFYSRERVRKDGC